MTLNSLKVAIGNLQGYFLFITNHVFKHFVFTVVHEHILSSTGPWGELSATPTAHEEEM